VFFALQECVINEVVFNEITNSKTLIFERQSEQWLDGNGAE